MANKREDLWLIALVVAACGLMIYVENVIQPVYVVKSCIKVFLFLGSIVAYCILFKQKIAVFHAKGKALLQIIIIAISVYILILICFFLLRDFMDLNQIRDSLMGKEGINQSNFIFVAVYISLINSFIEELFFRGFAFKHLKALGFQHFSHVFSAAAFSLYHIGIISGWFSLPMFVFIILALFAAGLILNLLCQYADSVLGSWVIHVSANLAINTIGFMIL